jgi:hypothetical protein
VSFPQSIADRVLVACGRHCALCHKYCGLKIELHHIKQQSAGGADTYENCIPLCFDCHADMRSYDHKHPKGRKFSEAELIAHRNGWYGKYAGAGGSTALPAHLELDRTLFRRIVRRLPYDGIVSELRNRYGGQPFGRGQLDPLADFLEDCHDPSVEFLDADLDAALAQLRLAVAEYNECVLTHVFVSDDHTELVIHPEMKYSNPDRYYPIVHEIARKEGVLIEAYGALVRMARRKLGIEAAVV